MQEGKAYGPPGESATAAVESADAAHTAGDAAGRLSSERAVDYSGRALSGLYEYGTVFGLGAQKEAEDISFLPLFV